jgi:hypothetical protein
MFTAMARPQTPATKRQARARTVLARRLEVLVHARRGSVRSDVSPSALAQMVLPLVTGDVAQRFVARERTLTESPAFIDAMIRLLSRT